MVSGACATQHFYWGCVCRCVSGEAPNDGEQGHDAVKDSNAIAQVEPVAGCISRRQQARRFQFLPCWHHRLQSPSQVTSCRKGRCTGTTLRVTWSWPGWVLGPPCQAGLSSGRWESMRRHSWYILLLLTAPGYSRNLHAHTHTRTHTHTVLVLGQEYMLLLLP